MYVGMYVKYTVFLSDFNQTCIFPERFSKNPQILNLIKMCPLGSEVFHAERRTDVTKLILAFYNFTNASRTAMLFSPTHMAKGSLYRPLRRPAKHSEYTSCLDI